MRATPHSQAAPGASDLYPAIEAYESGRLKVEPPHEVHWELSGNPEGVPVLFLHGGPGAGCAPDHRRFFDPAHYRALLFDQRGAGRSKPYAEVENNTTQALIADIERLREMTGARKWIVFGGSWGSTLALAYAQAHPERVLGLVLRGIFLGTAREIEWFLTGMRGFFPEAWDSFVAGIPPAERGDLLNAYGRRLLDPDPAVHLPAAQSWSAYEGRCAMLIPSQELAAGMSDTRTALALARLEHHYFANRVFLEEDGLIKGLDAIRHLPCTIVHGRYDVICPPVNAYRLADAWPEAKLTIVPDAGHSAMEPGIRRALVQAMEDFKHLK